MRFVALTTFLALLPVSLSAPGSPFTDIANTTYCSPVAYSHGPNLTPPFNLTVYEGYFNSSELINTTLAPIAQPAINSSLKVVSWIVDLPAGTLFTTFIKDSLNESVAFHGYVLKSKYACNESLLTLPYDAASVKISAAPARLSAFLTAGVIAVGAGSVAMLLF